MAAPSVSAAVALEKYPTSVTAVRVALSTHVVVIATGDVPVAVPPEVSGMVTAEGVARLLCTERGQWWVEAVYD